MRTLIGCRRYFVSPRAPSLSLQAVAAAPFTFGPDGQRSRGHGGGLPGEGEVPGPRGFSLLRAGEERRGPPEEKGGGGRGGPGRAVVVQPEVLV